MATKTEIVTFEDAKARYFEVMRAKGFEDCQIAIPANTSERTKKGLWVLHNAKGVLARVTRKGQVFFPE